jgi:hypothetical protein
MRGTSRFLIGHRAPSKQVIIRSPADPPANREWRRLASRERLKDLWCATDRRGTPIRRQRPGIRHRQREESPQDLERLKVERTGVAQLAPGP